MIVRLICVLILLSFAVPLTLKTWGVIRRHEFRSSITGETVRIPSAAMARFLGAVLVLFDLFFYYMIFVVISYTGG